jgi:hypothetical protein
MQPTARFFHEGIAVFADPSTLRAALYPAVPPFRFLLGPTLALAFTPFAFAADLVSDAPAPDSAATSDAPASVSAAAEVTVPVVEPAPEESTFQRIRSWSDVQLHTLYENVIVDPQDRHSFKLKPQPHARDVVSADYTRLDMRLFYGFAKKVEGEVAFGNYFATPGKDGTHTGIAYIDAIARYRWTPNMDPTGKATSGIEIYHPISTAPDTLTDGVNRYTAFCSYARTSTRIQNFQEFFNLSYTVIMPSAAAGVIPEDAPQNDFFTAAVGELRNRGPFTYGISVAWDHVTQGPREDFITLTPSITVEIPRSYTFNCPGQWQLGLSWAVRRFGGETDTNFRVRVRWLVKMSDIKNAWKHREANAAPR